MTWSIHNLVSYLIPAHYILATVPFFFFLEHAKHRTSASGQGVTGTRFTLPSDTIKIGQNIWNSDFQVTGHKTTKDSDSWETGSQWGASFNGPASYCIEGFQARGIRKGSSSRAQRTPGVEGMKLKCRETTATTGQGTGKRKQHRDLRTQKTYREPPLALSWVLHGKKPPKPGKEPPGRISGNIHACCSLRAGNSA